MFLKFCDPIYHPFPFLVILVDFEILSVKVNYIPYISRGGICYMKLKSIFSTVLLAFTVFFITSFSASASENDIPENMEHTANPNIFYDTDNQKYFDKRENGYIDEVYRVEGGKVVESISPEEFIQIQETEKNEFTQDSLDIVTPMAVTWSHIYKESSNYETRIFGQRASIIQENPGPGSDTKTISYQYTETYTTSTSLTNLQLQAIEYGVSHSFSRSRSISSSHTMTIEPGYSGYWRFDPKVRKSIGTLRNLLHGQFMSETSVTTMYPTHLNGQLDGWLVAVKTKL